MPPKFPCTVCKLSVLNSHKAIFCDICSNWTHLKCTKLSTNDYNSLSFSDTDWFCSTCLSEIFPFNHFVDDTDFYFALYDRLGAFCPGSINYTQFNSKYFNPFTEDPDTYQLLCNSDLDPDINMLTSTSNLLSKCAYLTNNEFNKLFPSITNCLSLFHLNIRSLKKHSDDLQEYLTTFNTPFSAIGISETWLDCNTDTLYSIPGYNFISNPRSHKLGGGVGIYLNCVFDYKKRSDLESKDQNIYESVFLEISQPNNKNIILGCVYKPPDATIQNFLDSISHTLSTISFENKLCYIMGDFNINILNADTHNPTNDFIDLMSSNGFYPLISKPTRITHHTATLIDNIFTNDLDHNKISSLLWSDISDHLPIFQITNFNLTPASKPSVLYKRQLSDKNILKFRSQLDSTDWEFIKSQSPNESYNLFMNHLAPIYNHCFPVKPVKLNSQANPKPWFTPGLQNSCRRKNCLYKQYRLNPLPTNKTKYSRFRNKYNHLVKLARKKYYHDKFENIKSSIRQTWSVIKLVISPKRSSSTNNPSTMIDHGHKITDPQTIANKFNNFFINCGASLASKIPNTTIDHKSFLKGSFPNSILVTPTTPLEINNIINSLKSSKSEGADGFTIIPIKACADLLASPISDIINISFTTGLVPDKLKIAKVIPIYKGEDDSNFSNYRPISILPCFDKILEKAMYTRLMDYFKKHNTLNSHQYGFRQGHATFMAILELTESIFESFENNQYTIGIFIDLKKAFDTVNHNILLEKLDFYGIRGIPLNWMYSYLNNRYQYVELHGSKSPLQIITCGVPQGSVLGPLLFLIYINDIFSSSKYLSFILFADDTNIFFHHHNISELCRIVNNELSLVATWLKVNKLTLHPDKTKFIFFHPPRKKPNFDDIVIHIEQNNIERVEHTKFLGVIIQQNLGWQPHIKAISSKIAKSIGIIIKSRQYFHTNTLYLLYNSLILPYLQYGTIIWASTYTTHLKPLLLFQKKALRIITHSPPRAHSHPLFKQLRILDIYKIYNLQVSCLVFRHSKNLLPSPLSSLFNVNSHYHSYSTRHKDNLHIHFHKYSFSLRHQGPRIWNEIPLGTRKTLSHSNYKRILREFFLSL